MCVHVLCIQLFFASKGGWSIFCIVHPCITEEMKIILKERERERERDINSPLFSVSEKVGS